MLCQIVRIVSPLTLCWLMTLLRSVLTDNVLITSNILTCFLVLIINFFFSSTSPLYLVLPGWLMLIIYCCYIRVPSWSDVSRCVKKYDRWHPSITTVHLSYIILRYREVQGELQLLIHHNLDTYIIYLYIIYHVYYPQYPQLIVFTFNHYFTLHFFGLQYPGLRRKFFHPAGHIFLWPCYWSDGEGYNKSLFWYQTCDRSSEDHYNIIRMSSITQSQYKQSHHQDASLPLSGGKENWKYRLIFVE